MIRFSKARISGRNVLRVNVFSGKPGFLYICLKRGRLKEKGKRL